MHDGSSSGPGFLGLPVEKRTREAPVSTLFPDWQTEVASEKSGFRRKKRKMVDNSTLREENWNDDDQSRGAGPASPFREKGLVGEGSHI
jgi:hypothetical protein